MRIQNQHWGARTSIVIALLTSIVGLAASRASAQTPPPAAAVAQATLAPLADPDKTNWTIGLGGTLNTGNTRTFAFSTNSHLQLKRHAHQLTADITGIYGLAAVRDATTNAFSSWNPNAGNVFGQLRYDFFMTPDDALVAAVQVRHDRFAGLELRFQGQLGYLRNFVNEENHRLWAEAGYDLTYDSFFYEPAAATAVPPPMANQVVHSARVFLGYDNHLNEAVTFLTGVEALFDFEDASNVRLNVISELRSKIGSNFQVSLQHTLRFDGVPPEGKTTLDNTLVVNLVYALVDETIEPPAEDAPAAP
jgi:putative salt-induced outer membrane protein YdiY